MSDSEAVELPEGWAWSKLGDLGAWFGGGTPTTSVSEYWDGGTIPWISAKDMKAERLGSAQDSITEGGRLASRLTLLPTGSVLMVVRGMILARAFPVALTTAPATINQDLRAIVPSLVVEPMFLLRALQFIGGEVVQATGEATHGTRRLESDTLKSWPIPVPPLAEQRRIVMAVERVLVSVASAREKLERVPKTMKRFRQAVLAAACSGRLTADWRETDATSDWTSTTLEYLIQEKPRNGFSPKAVDRPTAVKSLTLTATTSGVFKPEHFKYLDVEVPSNSYLWLQPGDILIQRSNTAEYVGVSAVFDGNANEFVYPDLMMKIRTKEGVDSRFIWCALSDERTRNYFRGNATGTAGNMPKINQGIVCSTPLNLPPHAEQLEIVRRVSRLLGLADSIEQRATAASRRVESLTQAVLAKAFRGELVPTEAELARKEGRDYEPANVLLARFKASSNGEAKTKRSRVKKSSTQADGSGGGLLEFMEG